MKNITFNISLDFEETLTFEELGLRDNETDREIINTAVEKYFTDLSDSDCLEHEERATVSDED
jgi:hypothetical protein